MTEWTIDWPLYAPGLAAWRPVIESEIEATRQSVARLVPPSRLTVEVRLEPMRVIPELGMVGHCQGPDRFTLSLAPSNPNFEQSLAEGALRRQVAHEALEKLAAHESAGTAEFQRVITFAKSSERGLAPGGS